MDPLWGVVVLCALVLMIIAIEVFSNRTMKRLGITPSPAAKWLRILTILALVVTIGFALYVFLTR